MVQEISVNIIHGDISKIYIKTTRLYTYRKILKMQQTIQISTPSHNGLFDITRQVEAIVADGGVQTCLVNVYVQGATAGIMM
jgi:hypothetical protein